MAFADYHFLIINPKRDIVQIKFFIKKPSGKLSTILSLLSTSVFLNFSPLSTFHRVNLTILLVCYFFYALQ